MTRIKFKKYFIFAAVIVFIFFPAVPARAQLPFGGLDISIIPCTCTPGLNMHIFTPFFLSAVPIVGALVAPITPTAFLYHVVHPGAWALGRFTPVAACIVGAPPFCAPIPATGFLTPFTGTSP